MKIGGKKPGVGTDNFVKKAGESEQPRQPDGGVKKAAAADSVDISDKARELNRVKKMLEGVPEVRGEVVVRLKTDIERGDYNVDTAKVAEKMIERALRNALSPKK